MSQNETSSLLMDTHRCGGGEGNGGRSSSTSNSSNMLLSFSSTSFRRNYHNHVHHHQQQDNSFDNNNNNNKHDNNVTTQRTCTYDTKRTTTTSRCYYDVLWKYSRFVWLLFLTVMYLLLITTIVLFVFIDRDPFFDPYHHSHWKSHTAYYGPFRYGTRVVQQGISQVTATTGSRLLPWQVFPQELYRPIHSISKTEQGFSNSNHHHHHHTKEEEEEQQQNYYSTTSTKVHNNKCDPLHIHLAQRTNIHPNNNNTDHTSPLDVVSMTLSVTFEYITCANVLPVIFYYMDDPNKNHNHSTEKIQFVIGTNPIQYNYNYTDPFRKQQQQPRPRFIPSFLKKEEKQQHQKMEISVYQSGYIYHIEIPELIGGLQLYKYRIVVFQQEHEQQIETESMLERSKNQENEFKHTLLEKQQQILNMYLSSKYHVKDKDDISFDSDNTNTNLRKQRTLLNNVYNPFILMSATDWYSFYTPPLPDTNQITTIAFVGDLGQTDTSVKTMANILLNQHLNNAIGNDDPKTATASTTVSMDSYNAIVTNVIIAGDISYADSDPFRWDRWFMIMEPLLRSIPISVAAGNHEIECDVNTQAAFVHYENRFYNPNRIYEHEPLLTRTNTDARTNSRNALDHRSQKDETNRLTNWHKCSAPSQYQGVYNYGNSFYSYTHSLVHIIVLNSYTSTNTSSIQYQWLTEELQSRLNRTVTPWLLVTFHAPLYTSFLGHNNESEAIQMKMAMEELFTKYGVNIVISGHDHAYLRTKSIRYNPVDMFNQPIIDPTGHSPIYLTMGTGGNREGHNRGYVNPTKPEPWIEQRTLEDYGYGRIQFHNKSHAYYEWVKDYNVNPNFMDHTWFYNHHN